MEMPNLTEIFGTYTAWKATEDTWFINFMNGSQCMYLLEGEEKALLIDTGWGAGNVKAFVERLTKKPLLVINTHFHPDHAGSNGEFTSVMVGEGYEKDMENITLMPFDWSKLPHPDYEKVVMRDGDVIDLGGRQIEVMKLLPAHCRSSLFLFDRAQGLMFVGDDLESTQVLMYTASIEDIDERLQNARKNYMRLKEVEDQITMLLPCHNGFPIALSYIDDHIGLVDHIYAGDAIVEEKLNHPHVDKDPIAEKLCRVRWGKASFFMFREDVKKVYGSKK